MNPISVPMTAERAKAILSLVQFPGHTFRVAGDFTDGTAYLQALFMAPCNVRGGDFYPQATRKWLLSRHMTQSELVQTAFKFVLTSLEHEAREQFTYRGAAIFGPHFDVEQLVALCERGAQALEVRP